MQHRAGFSRRTLLHLLLGGAAASRASVPFAPLQSTSTILRGFSREAIFERRYRVDATILLLGVPLLSKQDIGGAYASVETASIPGSRAVALQFAAGSWPARAKNLNRFGILREALVARPAEPVEIAFAALMTDSHEHTFSEARSAFSTGRVVEALVARGYAHGGSMNTSSYRVPLPADRIWTDSPRVLCEATRQDPLEAPRQIACGECVTFLHAVRCAALDQRSEHRQRFAHAGKLFLLETHRDPKQPVLMHGLIRDPSGARASDFRAVFAAGDESGLPVRIEFQPKPFLRLTLECEPDANQPPIPSVFEESA